MKLGKAAAVLAVAAAMAGAQFGASSAFAASIEEREIKELFERAGMMRSDGMVTRADFLKLMEKRFDAMDKKRRGMLTAEEVARIFNPIYNP